MGFSKAVVGFLILGIVCATIFLFSLMYYLFKRIKEKREQRNVKSLTVDDYFAYSNDPEAHVGTDKEGYGKLPDSENPFVEDYSESLISRPQPARYDTAGTPLVAIQHQ